MKKRFERIETKDEVLEKLQTNVERAIASQPFERVSTIRVKLYSGQRNIVEHKLELKPTGYFVSNLSSKGEIWTEPGVEISTAPTKFINLWTDNTQEYDITFFIGPNVQNQYNVNVGTGGSPGGWPNACFDQLNVCCLTVYETTDLNTVTIDNSLLVCCSITLCPGGTLTLPESSMYRGAIPIGSIIATFPHLTGAYTTNCLTSPDVNGFVLAAGQTINFAASPMNGVTIPNVNNNVFIKASTCSGYTGGAYDYTLLYCQMPIHTHEDIHGHSTGLTSLDHCHYVCGANISSCHGHGYAFTTSSDGGHQHCLGGSYGGAACDILSIATNYYCPSSGVTTTSDHTHCVRRSGENGYLSGGIWYTYDQRDCFCIAYPHCHTYSFPNYASFPNYYGGGANVSYISGAANTYYTGTTYVDGVNCQASYLYTGGVYCDQTTGCWCMASQCSTYAYCAACTTHSTTLTAHNHITCCQGSHWHGIYGNTCLVAAHAHTYSGITGLTCGLGDGCTNCAVVSGAYSSLTHSHLVSCNCGWTACSGLGCSISIIPCFVSAVYLMRII
jgi:hypothetical protein